MQVRNPNFPTEDVVRFTNDLFKNPRSFSFGPDFSFAQNSAGTRMMLPTTLQDRVRSLTQPPGDGGGAPGETPASRDNGSMQRPATTQAPAQSALERARGRTAPAPTQPTAAPTSRTNAARPRTVDAWIAQNAPAEGRGGLSDRELQQAAGWYNVPVVELRQRMKAWRQVEVPGGL
jgi:hypothetical protein